MTDNQPRVQVSRLTQNQDLKYAIRTAAQKWLDELNDYIIPGALTEDEDGPGTSEQESRRKEAEQLAADLIEYDKHLLVRKAED
jgi:hypothetical protein